MKRYLITYCDNKQALQEWMSLNYEDWRDCLFQTHVGWSRVRGQYRFFTIAAHPVFKNENGAKSLTCMFIRNQRQYDCIKASPLVVLAEGDSFTDEGDCPFHKVMANPSARALYESVIPISEEGIDVFCRC